MKFELSLEHWLSHSECLMLVNSTGSSGIIKICRTSFWKVPNGMVEAAVAAVMNVIAGLRHLYHQHNNGTGKRISLDEHGLSDASRCAMYKPSSANTSLDLQTRICKLEEIVSLLSRTHELNAAKYAFLDASLERVGLLESELVETHKVHKWFLDIVFNASNISSKPDYSKFELILLHSVNMV